MSVEGVEVRVARRPGTSTYDVTLPDGLGDAGGFTVTYFPEGDPIDEGTLRDEIAHNIIELRRNFPSADV